MPPTTKQPLSQSNLKEMWGSKKANDEPKAEGDAGKAEDQMAIDSELILNDEVSTKKRRIMEQEQPEEQPLDSKRAKPGSSVGYNEDQMTVDNLKFEEKSRKKKRRIIDSDDEEPTNVAKEPSSSGPPSRGATPSAKSKPRTKGKSKAVDVSEYQHEGENDPAASSGEEASEGEDEVDAAKSDDEELGTSSGQVASKSAEAALAKLNDVDIEGGWKTGAPVPYAALTKTFSLIESTTKRLEKNAFLTSFLLLVIQRSAKGEPKSLLQAVYLCINRLSPDYVGIELGIGESLLVKAIAESTGRSISIIKADLQKEGDLGLVAMNSKNSQKTLFKPKPLTIPFVFQNLKDIALTAGNASQAKKVSIITKLLAACQDFEAKYIVRSLEGKLRIGNAERSVLVALAHAAVLAEREQVNPAPTLAGKKWSPEKLASRLEQGANIIKAVYSELPSYDDVIPALLEHGIDGLRQHCKLTPGVPLKPMLAKPTKAIGEVLDRFENKKFTCEYKYDGERAQVHKLADGTVAVFSRNSEDMSKKYPDLVEQLPKCFKESTKSFVLDAEAVAIDRSTGKLMPFQELSRRKRKDVKVEDIQVRVCLFAFDLLYLNGEPLLQKTLFERRQMLREHFNVVPGEFDFAKSSDGETTEEIQSFLEESVKDGCEGLMVKMLDTDASYYEPSRRSVNWLKLKKDYLAGVGDSLDLVVIGGYYGKGKRTNVYGAFLLACYDSDSEEYQTICKIGTGFSEEMLQSHYETLKPLELAKVRGDVKVGGAKPDVWFEPKVVWEVLTADLSLSPIYTAAQGLVKSLNIFVSLGLTVDRIRDDKDSDDATGPEQVSLSPSELLDKTNIQYEIAEMYERQALAQSNTNKKKGGDADDGFW
ncbi:hypothetical protein H0H92_007218 [Tricholoma furcatifolium]|nr:hypothetical protein H0H92_007218 [Tricholoma furcatifolium]